MNPTTPPFDETTPDDELEQPDAVSRRCFLQSMYTPYESDDGNSISMNTDVEAAQCLLDIETLVGDILESEGTLFTLTPWKEDRGLGYKTDPLCEKIHRYILFADEFLSRHFPHHRFSPHAELFCRHNQVLHQRLRQESSQAPVPDPLGRRDEQRAAREGVDPTQLPEADAWMLRIGKDQLIGKPAVVLCDALNALVSDIRAESESAEFKRRVQCLYQAVTENRKSLIAYVNTLFERHPRIHVVRVDLTYYKGVGPQGDLPGKVTFQQALDDRQRFFETLRDSWLFRFVVGYVWKMEFGLEKGYHNHWLFFLNGDTCRNDVWFGKQVCMDWEYAVGKYGLPWNFNAFKNYYGFALGMIEHWDEERRAHLMHSINALTKPHLHLRLVPPDGAVRTFSRGEIPSWPKGTRGRPHMEERGWADI